MKPDPDKYQRLIENLPDPFAYHQVVTDAEGRPVDYIFLEINDAFEKMTGLKRDEVIGKRVTKVLPEIGKSGFDWIGTYGQVALGGEPARFENYSETLGRWYDVSVYSDKPGFFVTVFRDITENMQTEIELNKSKERLDMLTEHNLTIIWEMDSSGLYTYVSPIAETLLGYRPEELIGKIHFYELHPEDSRETFKNNAFEVIARKEAFRNLENSMQTKKGEILWFNTNGIPLIDENGDLAGYQGSDTDITRRKQVEKELRESEKIYRQLVDNIYDVVWTTDLNLNLTYVSPSVEKMVGEPVDVHLKKPIEEKFPPSSLDKISTIIKEEFEKENEPADDKNRSRKIEVEHYRADGSTIWLEMHVSSIRDQNENIIGFQGVSRDITDRKHVEEELFALKVFHENIVQNLNEGIIIYNNSGEAVFTNQTLLQMSGYEADEFIGTHWTLLVHSQYYQVVEEANARRSTGKSDRYEMAIKHKNGSLIPVQVSGSPYHDSRTGEMVGTLAVLTNLTDRVKAEEALQESEQRHRHILESMAEGFFETDLKGKIISCNRAAAGMLGFQEEEFLTMSYKSFCRDFNTVYGEFNQVFEKGESKYSLITELIRKDGSIITVDLSIIPVRNKQGNIVSFRSLGRDVTERRRAEEKLRESEMRSQALVKAIPDILFRFNREGVYLEAVVKDEAMLNPKARELYRQNRLIGKTMVEMLPADIADMLMTGIEKALASGEMQIFEYLYNAYDSEHYFEARLAPIGETEVVSIVRDITERKSYEAKLQYISFHDQLTGLYNRSYYENELKRMDSSREHPIAMISADIDGLKLVNDTFGHEEGDRYIHIGAELLKSTLRASDILARVGGDEFAIILPRITQDAGQKLVERMRHQIEEYNRRETTTLPLSISIGLAVSESSEQSLEETYKKADKAMYVDKLQRSEKARAMIVTLLLASLSKRSELFEGEREQVQALCLQMGRALTLDNNQMANLNLLSRTYDLGKVSLPDHIVHCNLLHKSGELTEAEREAIRRHPETGYRIASSSPELADIADLIMKHHENFDGSGYPLGLKSDKIPIECRIVAIAIAYSAMINPRPYAKTLTKAEAIKELQRCAGTQFDPQLVEVFTAIVQDEGGLLKPQAPG